MVTVKLISDYYGTLGVPRHTGLEGIRRAYLRKARMHHPDLSPGDPDAVSTMSAINQAYAALSDPARRDAYDSQRVSISYHPHNVQSPPLTDFRPRYQHRKNRDTGVILTALLFFRQMIRLVAAT